MAVDIASLSYILSSIASAGKVLETAIALYGKSMPVNFAIIKADADNEAAKEATSDDPQIVTNLAASIPQQILEAGNDAIKAVMDGASKVIRDSGMPVPEREQRLTAHQRELCHYISELSKWGNLPDTLLTLWKSIKCAEKGFVLH